MSPTTVRPLVVLAHGTASAAGRAVAEQITEQAGRALGVEHRLGYVDVCEPTAAQALAGVSDAVVVPLFLASGYHVRVDVPAAVAEAHGATTTSALGSGEPVVHVLAERVRETDPAPDGVLLTAAGSSDERARREVVAAAMLLSDELGVPVAPAYLSASGPRVPEAYDRLATTGRVVVASHLLGPGYFQSLLERQADSLGLPASAPLGAHPLLVDLVMSRYAATA